MRLTLFGLSCALDVDLSNTEISRIFSDAEEDQVSAKEYTLCSSDNVTVRVLVDEYEPETAHINVQSKSLSQEQLEWINEEAEYYFIREGKRIVEEENI